MEPTESAQVGGRLVFKDTQNLACRIHVTEQNNTYFHQGRHKRSCPTTTRLPRPAAFSSAPACRGPKGWTIERAQVQSLRRPPRLSSQSQSATTPRLRQHVNWWWVCSIASGCKTISVRWQRQLDGLLCFPPWLLDRKQHVLLPNSLEACLRPTETTRARASTATFQISRPADRATAPRVRVGQPGGRVATWVRSGPLDSGTPRSDVVGL